MIGAVAQAPSFVCPRPGCGGPMEFDLGAASDSRGARGRYHCLQCGHDTWRDLCDPWTPRPDDWQAEKRERRMAHVVRRLGPKKRAGILRHLRAGDSVEAVARAVQCSRMAVAWYEARMRAGDQEVEAR